MLFWCWAAAVGAGLLKSEDMMLAATRLRISFDIVYEEENFTILMDQATEVKMVIHLIFICRCQGLFFISSGQILF